MPSDAQPRDDVRPPPKPQRRTGMFILRKGGVFAVGRQSEINGWYTFRVAGFGLDLVANTIGYVEDVYGPENVTWEDSADA